MQTSQHPFAPMRKRMPPCTKVHLRWQRYEMALPRSSALQKGHARCPCDPFLPTNNTARQRARRVPRGTGASNLLRVSHRNAGMTKGYSETSTKGFYTHESRDISFTLVYNDLGVKYKDTADIEHLAKTLESYYTFKLEHFCDRYANVTLDWDYDARTVKCSMPGYAQAYELEA